ncbi:MAG: hypothetical protein LBJ46_02785 [Planctomycetota bacterium]|jgi:predicted dienelactone hydrolase|nr:hypothetical protein [Planctomycetota bacterium]
MTGTTVHKTAAPFNAGLTRIYAVAASGAHRIPASVWYPTGDRERVRRAGIYEISSSPGGAPVDGNGGLILLSHGSGGSDVNHHDWAETLARRGYVVVAPRHIGDSHGRKGPHESGAQLLERPMQALAARDTLFGDSRFSGRVDEDKIGAMGFSTGGYTVLALLGARPNFTRWRGFCSDHRDAAILRPFGDATELIPPGRTDWDAAKAFGVKAAVLFAPFAMPYTEESLRAITTPLRLYYTEYDSIAVNDWNALAVLKGVSGPCEPAITPGGHYVFIAPAADDFADKCPEFYRDAPGVDRKAIHARIGDELVAFFDKTLL